MRRLIETHDDVAATVARLALGVVMFPHGAQKVLGWFGGYGLSGTYHWFTGQMGIPGLFAALAIAAEFQYPCGALWFDVPLEVCAQRNRRRALDGGREVPEAALARMAAKLQRPRREEGFQFLGRVDANGETSEYNGSV